MRGYCGSLAKHSSHETAYCAFNMNVLHKGFASQNMRLLTLVRSVSSSYDLNRLDGLICMSANYWSTPCTWMRGGR